MHWRVFLTTWGQPSSLSPLPDLVLVTPLLQNHGLTTSGVKPRAGHYVTDSVRQEYRWRTEDRVVSAPCGLGILKQLDSGVPGRLLGSHIRGMTEGQLRRGC